MGVTTAKPSSYSLNSGATYYPDHLWMVDEGSGSTLEDLIGTWDLTITGADWGTDGTHGPMLTFVAANSDQATFSGITLATSYSWGLIINVASDPGAVQCLISFGDAAGNTCQSSRILTTGILRRESKQAGASTSGDTTFDIVTDTGFSLVTGSASDTAVRAAGNGSGGNTAHTHTGIVASLDRITVGAERDSATTNFADMDVVAIMVWEGVEYTNTEFTAIFNSGDPWTAIGVEASAGTTISPNPAGMSV